jgi:hypothetical protein
MALTRLERERITDSRLKLQSAAHALKDIDSDKVPNFDDIQECLEEAEKSLAGALRSSKSVPQKPGDGPR